MKYYYVSFLVIDGEYDESNEKIIEAKNKKKAIKKIEQEYKNEGKVEIDLIYETYADATT